MTKYTNHDILRSWLDAYAMLGKDTEVAKMCKVSRVTLWRAAKASEDLDPDLQDVLWGDISKPYHEQKLDALDMQIENVQQDITVVAGQGRLIPMVHSGAYCFEDCEFSMSLSASEFKYHLALDDETRDMLGYSRVWEDKKLRVQNRRGIWERVRAMAFIAPTVEAQAKVLSSFAPDVFGDKRKIDLNVAATLGVRVIGKTLQPPPHLVDVTPAVPEIEYNSTVPTPARALEPAEFTEIDPDEDEAQALPAQPIDDSVLDGEQRAILERLRSPSLLVRDLAEKAEQALKKRIATGDPDVSPQRTGYGPTPRGFKVV
jgi:hypothetical protein